jgi:hypothetical protein
MKEKEFIICSAIHIDNGLDCSGQPTNINSGFIITGRRHSDCYALLKNLVTEDNYQSILNDHCDKDGKHHGFLTSTNRFVDRKEAWKIAKENNQIQFGLIASDNGDDSILISENLY